MTMRIRASVGATEVLALDVSRVRYTGRGHRHVYVVTDPAGAQLAEFTHDRDLGGGVLAYRALEAVRHRGKLL